ncbi:uncharacterized protein A1O5_01331 [Cladophialophora psammophila CBS 110553]|uniref:Uncharacterized protein n=1 Tax=Cladophialophora psammophila CBS 110553 TaxID=1182543 RepID=W9X9A9_9EURO|nr:uncharacterized protein A1O5_01331 [Cladophialophora psammophila CBS 110553]EXJ76823.1 hypothetical protein A1O5_01331 [Cladophialophora psammophila CBS 110553]
MPLPRPAAFRGALQTFSLKRAGTQARTSLRGVGRRTYATEHGAHKSSDIPWLVGSLVVTVPAAGWLLQQGPQKSDHGHGSHTKEKHEEAPPEASKEEEEEEPAKEDTEGTKEGGKEEESQDEGREESASEGDDKETTPKGTALPEDQAKQSEEKGAKDAQGDVSGANNPFMGEADRSKKPEGMDATAKLHGTVDTSQRSSKGHHETGQKDD